MDNNSDHYRDGFSFRCHVAFWIYQDAIELETLTDVYVRSGEDVNLLDLSKMKTILKL